MPIRTDQKRETRGQNTAQTTNTRDGRLNPSVVHEFQPRAGKDKPSEPRRQRKAAEPDAPVKDDIGKREA